MEFNISLKVNKAKFLKPILQRENLPINNFVLVQKLETQEYTGSIKSEQSIKEALSQIGYVNAGRTGLLYVASKFRGLRVFGIKAVFCFKVEKYFSSTFHL